MTKDFDESEKLSFTLGYNGHIATAAEILAFTHHDQIEGWLSREESELLFNYARGTTSGTVVEIGSWRGKSSIALALGAQENRVLTDLTVYCVEPHAKATGILGGTFGPQDRVAFFTNVLSANCATTIALISLPSLSVAKSWSQLIGLLFIDGDHSEIAVRKDVAAWAPFVVVGGFIAFDDATNPQLGPIKAIESLVETGAWVSAQSIGKVHVLQRTKADPGALAQAHSCEAVL